MRASALNPAGASSPFPAKTGATPSSPVHTSSPACAYVTRSRSSFAEGSQIPDVGTRANTSPPRTTRVYRKSGERSSTPRRKAASPTRGCPNVTQDTAGARVARVVVAVVAVFAVFGPAGARERDGNPRDPRMSASCARRAAHSEASAPPSEWPTTTTRGGGFVATASASLAACARAQSAAAPSTSARSDLYAAAYPLCTRASRIASGASAHCSWPAMLFT